MEELTDRVQLCPDGKYRWTYEVNLYKNMTIFYDLMKVMGISFGFVGLVGLLATFYHGTDWESFVSLSVGFFWVGVFLFFLSLIGYWIWVRVSGGRYAALFVMDEESVTHIQMPETVKRGQLIGAIGSIFGGGASSSTTTAASLLAASINAWKTEFKDVRRVIPKRRRCLIKVNELLTKNRVFVENEEDYEFVLDYISQRCPRIKK